MVSLLSQTMEIASGIVNQIYQITPRMPRCSVYITDIRGTTQLQVSGHFIFTSISSVEDPTVTVNCRTTIKELFLYLNWCLSVILNSLSYLFTSISFLTNVYGQSETFLICYKSNTTDVRYEAGTAYPSRAPDFTPGCQ